MGKLNFSNCIILCYSVLLVQCQLTINQDVENRIIGESLPLILKFLNDDVGATINYNSGHIKHTQLKGDILEVDITALITCKSPSEQCNYDSADCRGLLFVKPNEELQVLSVDCNPNMSIEEPIALPVEYKPCEGCLVDIDVNGKGVEQLAKNIIQHIESEKGKKYDLIQITKVQSEVTNGVNYFLTVLIGRPPHPCDAQICNRDTTQDMYCLVKFFQEPGYYSPKNIISNNCTQTQTFIPVISKYESNHINSIDSGDEKNKYNEKDFYHKKAELSENDILKELMSQIIPLDESESKSTKNMEMGEPNPVKAVESSSANNLPDGSSQSVPLSSTYQEVLATEDEPISVGTDTAVDLGVVESNSGTPIDTIVNGTPTVDVLQQIPLDQVQSQTEVTSESVALESDSVGTRTDNDSASIRRPKRSLLGGKKELDVNDPRIKEYLGEAVDYLNANLAKGDSQLKIGKIVSATSQVVSGVSYDIKAELVDCSKKENSVETCQDIPKLCDINVWYQPWLSSRKIKINCEGQTYSFNALSENKRSKRETLAGGHTPLSNDDPRIPKHLQKLLPQLDSVSDKRHKLKIEKVLSATSQVVAGTNWNIKAVVALSDCEKSDVKDSVNCGNNKEPYEAICKFKFWEKLPDEHGERKLEEVKIDCDDSKLNFRSKREIHNRKPRDSLVGGHNQLSNDDPRISTHLQKLLPKLDSVSDKGNKLKIKKILSATSQVVAGTIWNIKAVVALSDCEKSDVKPSIDCENNKESYEAICKFKFWEKLPDENGERKLEEVKIDCDDSKLNFRSKREIHRRITRQSLLGGHNPLPNDDPQISKHLQKLLPKLDSVSDKGHKLKIKKILSATSQVVAGKNWNIKAIVALSDCEKSNEKLSVDCENSKETYETVCQFKFWEKLPDKNGERELEEVTIDCDDTKLNFRSKREIHSRKPRETLIGGHNPLSYDDPRISKHLQKLLPQLDSISDKGEKLKLKKIISATSQVVAGTNWNIKAVVARSNCDKSDEKSSVDCEENKESYETTCTFEFWEKLPDKNGDRKLEEVKITCDDSKLNFRSKREIYKRKSRQALIGGHNPLSNDDPRIPKHLQKLLPQLDSVSSQAHKLKIKKILSATSQVVAGTNWNIKAIVGLSDCEKSDVKDSVNCGNNKESYEAICKFKFWEKLPDKNGERKLEEIKIDCDDPKLNFRSKREIHRRKSRETLVVGGHNPLSNDDPRISKHLQNLLPKLDSLSDKENKLKIKKILSATSQVIAGTNWNIKAIVALSDCEKSDEKSSANCGNNKDSFETICKFKFWEKLPDENGERKLENIEIDCDDNKLKFRSKRSVEFNSKPKKEDNMPGGQESVDKSEPEIYKFLSESLQHVDLNSPHENKYKIKEIVSATKQVVEGYLWRIKVALILSDCNKNDLTDWDQCGELQDSEPKYCTIKIWNRPWLPHGRETNITCDNQKNSYSFRSKRSLKSIHLDAFEKFEKIYNKVYANPRERFQRFTIFQENMEKIKLLNDNEQGTAVYGTTKFADWTKKEFSKLLGYRSDLRNENEIDFSNAEIPVMDLPDSFDWRDKNVVTKVKNQGSCGSCWAFSVTGNVEGQYAIKNGKLLQFSEQELVDCDTEDQGCNGGLMDNAYRQIEKLGGLEEEKDYPYDARDEKCHLNKNLVRVELSGAVNISQDETEMAKWLVKNGPISIAINANAMQFYMGGVSHPWKVLCDPKNLDHGVLIVGYGVHTYPKFKKSLPYWIVKNSWGTSWGEQGYYRVYRGDGTCGVNQTPSSAILK